MALDVFFYPLQKHLYFELMVELVYMSYEVATIANVVFDREDTFK